MCKAFSAIISKQGMVYWKAGLDSHEDIIKHFKLKEPKDCGSNQEMADKCLFVKVEVSPKNKDYLNPDKWEFHLDERFTPNWFKGREKMIKERAFMALEEWKKITYDFNVKEARKPIHPFKIKPPKKITKEHIALLKEWASVRDSVRDSVWDSVWASVRASVWASVWASVRASVWASVWDSVRDSVGAYIGSLFPKIEKWKYAEKIKVKGYPFQSAVTLWKMGLVPSFDGTVWRLHAHKDARVVFTISGKDLMRYEME